VKDLIDAIAGLPARGAVKQNFRVSNATAQALLGSLSFLKENIPMLFLIWLQLFQIQHTELETTPADVWSSKIRVW
jgi:hypothetical protein